MRVAAPPGASCAELLRGFCEEKRWGLPSSPPSCQPTLLLQAAAHEPPRSPEVALCFANRSAALFHLGHFEVSRGSDVSMWGTG